MKKAIISFAGGLAIGLCVVQYQVDQHRAELAQVETRMEIARMSMDSMRIRIQDVARKQIIMENIIVLQLKVLRDFDREKENWLIGNAIEVRRKDLPGKKKLRINEIFHN